MMCLEVTNEIRLTGYPPALYTELIRLFTLENPKALEAERLGRRFDLADRFLCFWRLEGGALVLPRGAARTIMHMAEQYGRVEIDDRRLMLPPCGYEFNGQLIWLTVSMEIYCPLILSFCSQERGRFYDGRSC